MKKFWCSCYILFQLFWTHSQSLPCHGDKPCVNFCCAKNFVVRDNMCKIANETEYVTKIHQHYDNYTHVHTKLQCDGGETYLYSRDTWQLTVNGIIINRELYDLDNYCIEQTEQVSGFHLYGPHLFHCVDHKEWSHLEAPVCASKSNIIFLETSNGPYPTYSPTHSVGKSFIKVSFLYNVVCVPEI